MRLNKSDQQNLLIYCRTGIVYRIIPGGWSYDLFFVFSPNMRASTRPRVWSVAPRKSTRETSSLPERFLIGLLADRLLKLPSTLVLFWLICGDISLLIQFWLAAVLSVNTQTVRFHTPFTASVYHNYISWVTFHEVSVICHRFLNTETLGDALPFTEVNLIRTVVLRSLPIRMT